MVGAKGVTDGLIGSVDLALADHELIKVKFVEFKEAKKEIAAEIRAGDKKGAGRPHRQYRHPLPAQS